MSEDAPNAEEMTPGQKWFHAYLDHVEESTRRAQEKPMVLGRYVCPCCQYPTLSGRGHFEMCPLCWWEDDGQDDPYADEVWGGPNADYSLTEARENFKQYLITARPNNDPFIRNSASDTEEQRAAKRVTCAAYDQMMNTDAATQEKLMAVVEDSFATLEAELTRKITEYEAQRKAEVMGSDC